MIKYSLDDEMFDYDTAFEAIQGMDDPEVGHAYYSATAEFVQAEDLIRTYSVVEQWCSQFYDLTGIEDCDYLFTLSDEANDELREILATWIDKHLQIHRFYHISSKSTKHFVTEEDLKELNDD